MLICRAKKQSGSRAECGACDEDIEPMEHFLCHCPTFVKFFWKDTIPNIAHLRGVNWEKIRQFVQNTDFLWEGWLVLLFGDHTTSLPDSYTSIGIRPLVELLSFNLPTYDISLRSTENRCYYKSLIIVLITDVHVDGSYVLIMCFLLGKIFILHAYFFLSQIFINCAEIVMYCKICIVMYCKNFVNYVFILKTTYLFR